MAATVHGTTTVTYDLDVCVKFDAVTCERILGALRGLDPRQRMRPDRLPLPDDPAYIVGNRNLYVATSLGVVDFLGELTGVGGFEEVRRHAEQIRLGDLDLLVISLDQLIASKRAMGRPKDQRAAVELELIRSQRKH
ncbi:MAG: hypothetical protein JNK82_08890 [Myxococcaceae bacterium]|nr:hypothetical protein [Myxococcaceae bacterium]